MEDNATRTDTIKTQIGETSAKFTLTIRTSGPPAYIDIRAVSVKAGKWNW
jgi:hypothetical protein